MLRSFRVYVILLGLLLLVLYGSHETKPTPIKKYNAQAIVRVDSLVWEIVDIKLQESSVIEIELGR